MIALSQFAYDENDSETVRLEKLAILLISGSCIAAGCVWAAMYFFLFGWGLVTALPILFVLIVSFSLFGSHIRKNIRFAIYTQIVCIIYIPSFVQWGIGGLYDSGLVITWALCGPIVALVFLPIRQATIWFLLYGANILITVLFNDYFSSQGLHVDETTQRTFILLNVLISSTVIFGFAGYFVSKAVTAERTLTGAVNAMGEGFAYFDNKDRLTIFNQKFASLAKLEAKIGIGTDFEDMLVRLTEVGFGDNFDVPTEEFIDRGMRLHRNPKGQYSTSFADGTWVVVTDTKTGDGGSVIALTDVTNLKRAENELAEKEAQLRTVLDNMPGGVRYIDRHKNYVFFKSQYSELYDFPDDLLKVGGSYRVENDYQALRGDFGTDDPDAFEGIGDLPAEFEPQSWERTTVLGKTLKVNTAPTPTGGIVNIVTDITERKRAEDELNKAKEELEIAHRQANDLLLNAIPETIAERLKNNPDQLIADRHADVSILFADIAGFTALSANQDPAETVNTLNNLFSEFDDVCDDAGVEKIRTIGDGYMVVGGAPQPLENHPVKMIEVAKELVSIAHRHHIDIRIGINSGEVVAGIVGIRRFHYDVWGDAVNIAARMETTGKVGKIHISSDFAERLEDRFPLEKLDPINIKGRGTMQTWFVETGTN